ncbi:hypothetical protein GGS21DRAFT_490610 [Xylaria nigripes]|nr:hypothetical protein GGS21DRAFT_490610 [Xylaria nigripes]
MKALPKLPDPDGSRVIRKRHPVPRLGDHLLTVVVDNGTPAQSSLLCAEPDVPVTLTTSNLDQLAKYTESSGDSAFLATSSVCSDEDVILISRLNQSSSSKSSSNISQSHTHRGYETPPTTLDEDDSSGFPSDREITVKTSSPISGRVLPVTDSTLLPLDDLGVINGSSLPIAKCNCKSPTMRGSYYDKESSKHSLRHVIPMTVSKLPKSLDSKSVHTTVEVNIADETTRNAESLHNNVRGLLATEAKAKNFSPLTAEVQENLSLISEVSNKPKPFWDLQRILDFYMKGVITPEKAKETAKRNGYTDVIDILDHATALRGKTPSLHTASVIVKAAKEGTIGDVKAPLAISQAKPQYDRLDLPYHTFTQKLSVYCAQDEFTAPARQLHIFVDISNIHIGFCDSWKISQSIPIHQYIRAPAFNFKVLNSIMQRNRAIKKKILVGSVAHTVTSPAQWPQYFIEAQAQGYKMKILNRVQKISSGRARRGRNRSPLGINSVYSADLTSSDESSGDLARASYATRNGEQGVDELLHLNMMDSVLDQIQKPGTMVLATGDAARAEFSDGFLQYATRALDQGWNLELVTWKKTISSAWINPKFRNKYGHHFRIVYLDEFLEELNGDLSPSLA